MTNYLKKYRSSLTLQSYLAILVLFFSCNAPDLGNSINAVNSGNNNNVAGSQDAQAGGFDNNGNTDPIDHEQIEEEPQDAFSARFESGTNFPKIRAISTRAYIDARGSHRDYDHVARYEMTEETLTVINDEFSSDVGELNDSLKKKRNTRTVFRTSTKEQSNAGYRENEDIGDLFKFMISASSGSYPKGGVNFSLPIPVIPTPLSRLSMQNYLGNTYQLDWKMTGSMSRDVKTTVRVRDLGSNISIIIETDVGASGVQECEILDDFIFAQKVEFIIDPNTKKVIESILDSCTEDKNKVAPVHAEYRLETIN